MSKTLKNLQIHDSNGLNKILQKGQLLYCENDSFRGIFMVISGVIKQYRLTIDGEEVITGFLLPGEWCGLSDLSKTRYSGSAKALDTSTVRLFSSTLLKEIMSEQQGRKEVYNILSNVIKEYNQRYYLLTKACVKVRLAMFIIDMSNRYGLLGYSSREFRLPMSRGDIAKYLGVVPETISREFTYFEKNQIFSFRNHFITINQFDILKKIISNG
ncbi:cyclic nucleotide-binding domain-containing protein [Escherichia coli]|uniref:cyclic nucleotide-binding domain-containing protein n=1 Tax=Escherichia coli TaxID=562 RepID=UPI0038B61D2A